MAIPRAVAPYYSSQIGEHRDTLLEMRARILSVIPDAQEIMKYGMPTFMVDGVEACGLLANKNHIGFYPYSGSVLSRFPELVGAFKMTKGALHVPLGKPLPKVLLRKLIRAKLSDCPVVQRTAPVSKLSDAAWVELGLAAPARRALLNAKIVNLKQLARHKKSDIADLHGMGPNAIRILISEMKKRDISFRK